MKAIICPRYGTPDVLQLREVLKPVPKDNEVLIQVQAACINSWDWDFIQGKPLLFRLLFGLQKPKYPILGCDVAGRVETVGKNITRLRPGDEVFGDLSGCTWGGFAEYVCAPEEVLALKPSGMTFEQAAATPQAGVLALQGLRYRGTIQPGQRVLIVGAGGGVGTFAIQMAKNQGAEVTAIDSTEKLDRLRSLGADHVLDYTRDDFADTLNLDGSQPYDLILDVVGQRSVFKYLQILRPGGRSGGSRYVMLGGTPGRIIGVASLGVMLAKRIGPGTHIGILAHKPNRADLDELSFLFETGQVVPVIDRTYPLHEVPDAFRYFGTGEVQGKVVIRM
ncbi:NAD(P)-dependent alcohol dehydrogenase [Telluribacter sp.]|jgi:NADPH:quinone reductase-like Zn-dependent oxidoreductase|uniref:NAD(P)-dependent alcohol dehydrogenase n=1 Tax=Telluribacter sp. TaxID=1978767 RepID=UPI002E14AD50|nr:NAD(P)-dependent alcohol dehydrogenase [Telluribacter sp.]